MSNRSANILLVVSILLGSFILLWTAAAILAADNNGRAGALASFVGSIVGVAGVAAGAYIQMDRQNRAARQSEAELRHAAFGPDFSNKAFSIAAELRVAANQLVGPDLKPAARIVMSCLHPNSGAIFIYDMRFKELLLSKLPLDIPALDGLNVSITRACNAANRAIHPEQCNPPMDPWKAGWGFLVSFDNLVSGLLRFMEARSDSFQGRITQETLLTISHSLRTASDLHMNSRPNELG